MGPKRKMKWVWSWRKPAKSIFLDKTLLLKVSQAAAEKTLKTRTAQTAVLICLLREDQDPVVQSLQRPLSKERVRIMGSLHNLSSRKKALKNSPSVTTKEISLKKGKELCNSNLVGSQLATYLLLLGNQMRSNQMSHTKTKTEQGSCNHVFKESN